jgi:GTP pyrophosphokinase
VKDTYAALGIIHQTWQPIPGRVKDFIAMPRPNGYQSLHIGRQRPRPAVRGQIRTIDMHRIAEEGIAAHCYRKAGSAPSRTSNAFPLAARS